MGAMSWIDIVVIAIIVISAIIGLAKGLFESILSLFGTALSLFVAIWASQPVATFLNKVADVDTYIKKLLVEWGVANDGVVKILLKTFTVEKAASLGTIILSVIVVFILIKLVIWLLSKLFDSATTNNSALSGLNRLLGFVFGAVKGLAFIAIALGVTSLVSNVAFEKQINAEIGKTKITNFIYKYVDSYVDEKLEDKLRDLIGDPETETKVASYNTTEQQNQL